MKPALFTTVVTMALVAYAANAMAAETVQVLVKGMAFAPAAVIARVGDTIIWTNQDFVAHTATTTDKQWDLLIPAGKSASLVVTVPGTIAYFCRFHPMMKGTVFVAE